MANRPVLTGATMLLCWGWWRMCKLSLCWVWWGRKCKPSHRSVWWGKMQSVASLGLPGEICPPRGRPHLGTPCRRGPCAKHSKSEHTVFDRCHKRRVSVLMRPFGSQRAEVLRLWRQPTNPWAVVLILSVLCGENEIRTREPL